MMVGFLIDEFISNNETGATIGDILQILAFVVAFIISLAYILSMNIHVFSMIIHSFDFWYKMTNLILYLISISWMNLTEEESKSHIDDLRRLFVQISCFTIFLMLFLSDAILLTANVHVTQFFYVVLQ